MDLGRLIPRHARYRADHTAVVFGDQRLDYLTFNNQVNRLANTLRALGVHKGDRIAAVLPNRLELLELYWACGKLGAISVPLSPLLNAAGIKSRLEDADPRVVIGHSGLVESLEAIRKELPDLEWDHTLLVDAGDRGQFKGYQALLRDASTEEPPDAGIQGEELFNICYSSGTTGLPKGITHSHFVRAMYATLFAGSFRMTPESVCMHNGSIVFNGAWVTLMPTFYLGATYILEAAFDPEDWIEAVHREGVTHVMLVPSQVIAILNAPNFSADKLQSLEMILSLGAPLHRIHKTRIDEHLPGRFYELYGLTEGFITILDKQDFHAKPDSVGAPPPFYQMRICDDEGNDLPAGEVGEIVGRGPIMSPGYYKRPELNARTFRDGWLFTGDMGRVDEDGYLYLVDRKKDMIISGGVNVYPTDIEAVVIEHPAVMEAAVFGGRHDKWGEVPVAAVVLRTGEHLDARELMDWVNQRVAAKYQRLQDALLIREMPRNVAGKTLKRTLRDDYEHGRLGDAP